MAQEKRCGNRVTMPSKVQIIHELKVLMRHDAELAASVVPAGDPGVPAARPSITAMSQTGSE